MINHNEFWEYLKEGFLNLVFPLSCENCGKEIKESKGYAICEDCLGQIKFISAPYCYRCGKPLSSLVSFEERAICADCHNHKIYFDFARSVTTYQGIMKKCIHLLKYQKQVKLVQPLGNLIIAYLLKNQSIRMEKIELIVPVPLYNEDYQKRGFNQSALLGRYVADYFLIPFSESLLVKEKPNESQVGLSKKERRNNVKKVYGISLSHKIEASNILLIDDIYTTGATIEACSKELRKIRVENLFVLTLARGV